MGGLICSTGVKAMVKCARHTEIPLLRFLSSLFINRSINTYRSMQFELFKEKLREIRGWGQDDRHFAAYYRLFLN